MTTDETMHCARHPREVTAVTCASCGTPICPRCMVSTPVGLKCPDCGTLRKSPLYKVRPERLLLSTLVALVAGVGAAIIGEIGFLAIFVASAYGYFAGSLILRASGMKRGTKLEVFSGAGVVIGALAFKVLPGLVPAVARALAHTVLRFGPYALLDVFLWVAVVITAGAVVSRIRYL